MPKLFAATIALFLLLGAGYGLSQAARSIPWNCSDWQPYAHADRTTAILESLAENRGKTLYCGIDQSDTFGKAETWAAGKDRNERDDTVYFGERGRFRGFIAAQEGWLTEGESGITGQSIAHIFEFPKEERKRRRKRKQYLRDQLEDTDNIYMWSNPGPAAQHAAQGTAQSQARQAWIAAAPTAAAILRYARQEGTLFIVAVGHPNVGTYPGGVNALCRHLGYQRAVNVDPYLRAAAGGVLSWQYITTRAGPGNSGDYITRARRAILFRSGDCVRER